MPRTRRSLSPRGSTSQTHATQNTTTDNTSDVPSSILPQLAPEMLQNVPYLRHMQHLFQVLTLPTATSLSTIQQPSITPFSENSTAPIQSSTPHDVNHSNTQPFASSTPFVQTASSTPLVQTETNLSQHQSSQQHHQIQQDQQHLAENQTQENENSTMSNPENTISQIPNNERLPIAETANPTEENLAETTTPLRVTLSLNETENNMPSLQQPSETLLNPTLSNLRNLVQAMQTATDSSTSNLAQNKKGKETRMRLLTSSSHNSPPRRKQKKKQCRRSPTTSSSNSDSQSESSADSKSTSSNIDKEEGIQLDGELHELAYGDSYIPPIIIEQLKKVKHVKLFLFTDKGILRAKLMRLTTEELNQIKMKTVNNEPVLAYQPVKENTKSCNSMFEFRSR